MKSVSKETDCPKQADKKHCECWYDGHPCCLCDDISCTHNWTMVGDEMVCYVCMLDVDSVLGHTKLREWTRCTS